MVVIDAGAELDGMQQVERRLTRHLAANLSESTLSECAMLLNAWRVAMVRM